MERNKKGVKSEDEKHLGGGYGGNSVTTWIAVSQLVLPCHNLGSYIIIWVAMSQL